MSLHMDSYLPRRTSLRGYRAKLTWTRSILPDSTESVKTAITAWPWRSWMLYRGLTDCVLVHVAEGTSVIYTRYVRGRMGFPNWLSPRGSSACASRLTKGNSRTAALAGVVALPVLTGL
ncbi:hypothetical protein BKA82DRAFT_4213555 [Pisolithus tinctorius]|nr:hypothetical protein BKA82DRAFT_4213555 [Pisolithus tinctorius]